MIIAPSSAPALKGFPGSIQLGYHSGVRGISGLTRLNSRRVEMGGADTVMTAEPVPLSASPAAAAPGDRQSRLARQLLRAQAGETAALHEVVRELNPLLWHVARSQGLAAEEAADVVQTTWLGALRRGARNTAP